ncbi:glutathione S-transferase theta-1-like isoform X2 [Phaenicophaeus curvirostris]|uniref:glutathione S-transferase theta-1-like isoform X2 n=1 Tax=Phaenicophaeus curvirostris TaxID=33595 RepID=UPI0037F0B26D
MGLGLGLELYLDLLSQPCRALYIFARANDIPFEFKRVELMKGQHKTEEFRKVNALMKVPALKDGSFTLAESLWALATTSLRTGRSWPSGAGGWKKRWGSSSSRKPMKAS